MIKVTITRDASGYREIEAYGHAGYDGSGKDIICAAVSTLILNTLNCIELFTDDAFEEQMDEKTAEIRFRFNGAVSERSELLLDTMVHGLKDLEQNYESYLSLTEKSEEVE